MPEEEVMRLIPVHIPEDLPEGKCPLCERDCPDELITKHHYFPRALRNNARRKYAKEREIGDGISLCSDCHIELHRLISNKDLANRYNTAKGILAHDKFAAFIDWVRKRPLGVIGRRPRKAGRQLFK
jgi:hypothetical protein